MPRAVLRPLLVLSALLLSLAPAAPTAAQQGGGVFLFKHFEPSTIGPGNVSVLVFEIGSEEASPIQGLSFTDALPAGVVVADPSTLVNGCDGAVSAPPGGATISLTGGRLPAFGSCTIEVDATSDVEGDHLNTTGPLTWDGGSSSGASDTLTVDGGQRIAFDKTFSPDSILVGETTTITFTLSFDNEFDQFDASFTDELPGGLVVASPPNASTDCPGASLSAPAGGTTIAFTGATIPGGGAPCTATVDVAATAAGTLVNRTSELTTDNDGSIESHGRAVADLDVELRDLLLTKTFVDDPTVPGGHPVLRFSVTNFDEEEAAAAIAFSDDLGAALPGLEARPPLPTDPCGAGSTLTGTSVLALTGGSLGPGETCSFDVTLTVPESADAGSYVNVAGPVTGTVGGEPVVGNEGADTLDVVLAPRLEKSFSEEAVPAGGSVVMTFEITNTDPEFSAFGIAFTDDFATFVGLVPTDLPKSDVCGEGSTLDFTLVGPEPGAEVAVIELSDGSLPGGGSCTFDVALDVPVGTPPGTYTNTTSEVSAFLAEQLRVGDPASADLTILGGPRLAKDFLADPVVPGDVVTLELTLTADPGLAASDVAFTDDLEAVLSGLASISPTQSGVCGPGSEIAGTSVLSFTGGSLAAGASCTFSVEVLVPDDASPGDYTNTTSDVTATVESETVVTPPAADVLRVRLLDAEKAFDNPAVAGGTTTLTFTLENLGSSTLTDIEFTDDLDAVVTGLTSISGTQTDVCGTGSSISGTSLLTFEDGNLGPLATCTFQVVVAVPDGTPAGEYLNVTSEVTYTAPGDPVAASTAGRTAAGLRFAIAAATAPPASAVLVVVDPLAISKSFLDDPAAPGELVTLRFTIENLHPTEAATDVAFTDDLDAALTGLEAEPPLPAAPCGAGSTLTGTSVLTLTGGTLAAGGSCTFDVFVRVPAGASAGTTATNVTSAVTGTIDGSATTGNQASDVLRVDVFALTKSFDGPTTPGGTVVLEFTIENLGGSTAVGLSFTDDLDATLPGLVATGLPQTGVCGAGSQIAGTSLLTFSGGSLGPGASCTFSVTLSVPGGAAPGTYPNTTSELSASGFPVGTSATDELVVEAAPSVLEIPTLDRLGLLLLAGLVLLAGASRLRRAGAPA